MDSHQVLSLDGLNYSQDNITEPVDTESSTFRLDDGYGTEDDATSRSLTNLVHPLLRKGAIRSLELCNFKSYCGTVVIEPFSHFTAIIGPNGSGKSNLMDAISFVLCIKATTLRGINVKDLIYSGPSPDETPTERCAHVSLTLESDTGPAVFKRMISSKGSITYVYNNNVITFKGYTEALREYRINSLGATGLIFQGAVNDILSQGPSELTRLFENISGSSLYEKPYNYIKEKLEIGRTEYKDYVSRKKQLQSEIRQYKSVVGSSKNHAEQWEEYKKVESLYYASKYFLLQNQFEHTCGHHNELVRNYDEFIAKRSSIDSKKRELENERASLYYTQAKLNRIFQQKEIMLNQSRENLQRFFTERSSLTQEIQQNEDIKAQVEKELEMLLGEYRETESLSKQVEAEIEAHSLEVQNSKVLLTPSQLSEFNESLKEFHKNTASIKIKMNIIKSNMEEKQSKYQQNVNRLASLNQKITQVQELSKRHEDVSQGLQDKLRGYKDSMELLATTVGKLSMDATKLSDAKNALEKQKVLLDEKIKSLGALKSEYRNIFRRMQTSKALSEKFQTVHGEVISLFQINNACYRKGIMAALGPRLHTIIVQDYDTVSLCIDFLKTEKSDRCDFLPLESLNYARQDESESWKRTDKSESRRQISEMLKRFSKLNYVFAIHCIDFSAEYKPLFEYLLGDVIIVSNLDEAEKVATLKLRPGRSESSRADNPTVVTQMGQVIARDKTIIIGQVTLKNSELEMKIAEYSKHTNKLKDIEAELSTITKRDTEIQESISISKNRIEKYKRMIELTKLKSDFSEKQKEAYKTQIDTLSAEVSSLNNETKTLKKAIDTFSRDLETENKTLQVLQQTHFSEMNAKFGVEDVYRTFSENSESLEKLNAAIANKKAIQKRCMVDLEDLKRKIQYIKDVKIPSIETNIGESRRKLDMLNSENQKTSDELEVLKADVEAAKLDLENSIKAIEECNLNIKNSGKDIDSGILSSKEAYEKEICLAESKMSQLRLQANDLVDECKIKNTRLNFVQCELPMHVTEKYEFPVLANASDFDKLPRTEKAMSNYVTQLEQELKDLKRTLSHSASFSDAESKLEQTTKELEKLEQDMEQSRAQILKLEKDFEKIKKERSALFLQCFNSVKNYVGPIYNKLSSTDEACTNGGQAFLSLDDDRCSGEIEPFMYNIRYNTIPPMKKYLDISLQSGGEKALSSIALLLALHNYRESPFIVLDEIDANIDSVKLKSLTNFLTSSNFQVIIITLKDKLFSSAQSLVGVYRQQPYSISKCVVLNLDDYQDETPGIAN
ncbi:structural maintenance of chromosomes smc1, putative [Theileria equi strain WA]|uniref:Structural maintenance of chromosomes protein n=1 Tax=Theileria equi strain WA TaxID=1537102 RepID=L0AYI2_THEEQ|nr:structural maintenance of chromosomes smc1, putative [Theileria equi strain WA]AFZ80313.1 structural maintenance of chromosomes smc1, putative [Theileria equi strain WA]|eukprot:XP_004829979.1 structural maintenance of chromosomes smc1, putative [Theileria equi strain WA]